MTNVTDKVRAALELASKHMHGFPLIDEALRELDGMSLIETEKLEGRDGMVLVPVEPTGPQMIAGGKKHQPNKHGEHETLHSLLARETYHAMIAPYLPKEN